MERIAADDFTDAAILPGMSVSTPPDGIPSLAFDPEKYRHHVDHLAMDADQKNELLRAVWDIMQSFVDRAFGDDAAQLVSGAVGKSSAKDETDDSVVVASPEDNALHHDKDKLSHTFRHMAGSRGRRKR